MHGAGELRGGRLAKAVFLVALGPAVLGTAIAAYGPAVPSPGPPRYDPLPLAKSPVLAAYQMRELDRSRRTSAKASALASPTLLPPVFPEPLPTLVLSPRGEPYRLAELARLVPEAFEAEGTSLLVKASLEVPVGSALTVDAAQTPEVRLSSSPSGFAAIISRGGTIKLQGAAQQQLVVTSWDSTAAAEDREPADGRAFVLTLGGRMDVIHADVGHLGFGTGSSSGLAWHGKSLLPGGHVSPATGNVTNSTLHDNWFGAYTHEAVGMRWADNVFTSNYAYGFDPHDFSNDFVVERNVAHGNGRHGFIFSRGCDRNVLRDNVAYDNRGHGFMIDDGRTEDTDYAAASVLTSDDNVLERNHAYDNDGSGVEIEGGTGNVVRDNLLERNHVGVRVKNGAVTDVVDNTITDSRLFGVHLFADSAGSSVRDNTVTGGWGGISTSEGATRRMSGNEIEDAYASEVVDGDTNRGESLLARVGQLYRSNPMLLLWTAVLGLPLVACLSFRISETVRRHYASPATR